MLKLLVCSVKILIGIVTIQVNLPTEAEELRKMLAKSLNPQPRQKAEKARRKRSPQPNDLEKLTRYGASL